MDDIAVEPKNDNFVFYKAAIMAAAALYFLGIAANPSNWTFLNGVNLVIHEAGHLIFGFGGEFMMVAGGSLMQIIMPLAFVLYFCATGQRFSGALVMFWLGQSILNVSVYAADASAMNLPLLGGDGTIHDWNYLLNRLNLLPQTALVAGMIRGAGTLVVLAAAAIGFSDIYRRKKAGRKVDFYK